MKSNVGGMYSMYFDKMSCSLIMIMIMIMMFSRDLSKVIDIVVFLNKLCKILQ